MTQLGLLPRCLRMACGLGAVTGLLTGGSPARLSAQDVSFRAAVDVVTVGVSVLRGGRPVRGLQARDFTVLDNGVVQQVTGLSYEALPVDLTIVFDVSGSVSGPVIDQLRRGVGDVRRALRPQDRLRLVTFNMAVRRLVDFDEGAGVDAAFADVKPGGGSAVRDAVAVALASGSTPGRRHLIILFTDGYDGSSIATPDTLLAVARATTPAVFAVLAKPGRVPSDQLYIDLAEETGGTVVSLLPTDNLGNSLRSALDQFRSAYVLTYTPSDVERAGDHRLEVRVNRPDLTVRARRGYVVPD
jgi:Ca-activated chloride channel family protein